MIEIHPFIPFVPKNSTVLILGSFPGLHQTRQLNDFEEWFYSAKRNQFWKILSAVYSTDLNTIEKKKELFEKKGIAITDVILKAKRKKESNLDQHLYEITTNKEAIQEIISNSQIKHVYFTSKFVEKHFRTMFPDYKFGESIPSPSPRFAKMKLSEKINVYKTKLPQ